MRSPVPVVWCFEDADDYLALRQDSKYIVRTTDSVSEICKAVAGNEASCIVCCPSRISTDSLSRIGSAIQRTGSSTGVVLRLNADRKSAASLLPALQIAPSARL